MNNDTLCLPSIFAIILISFFLFLSCNFLISVWILTNEIAILLEKIKSKFSEIKTILLNFFKHN